MSETPEDYVAEPIQDKPVFALVEIMGHRKHYGSIREVQWLGVAFLEVTTPHIAAQPSYERPDVVKQREYDYSTGESVILEIPGRYVRAAAPEVESKSYRYHPQALYGVEAITQEECIRQHLASAFCDTPREQWIPDEPVKALPAPMPDDDPWANRDDEEDE